MGFMMEQKVAEFMANLLIAKLSREEVGKRSYEYALALQTDELPFDNPYVSSDLMFKASRLVGQAWAKTCCIRNENEHS